MTAPIQTATSGAPITRAKAAMILLHGRGASAESMLSFAEVFAEPDIACLAPQSPGGSWYPYSFLAPIDQNEPFLSRSLATVGKLVADLSAQGFGPERLVLLGFSQGGCLALEFAARNAQAYGAVIGLSAGLIGPEGAPRAYAGSLAGTRVFLGCSDSDAHIPLARVHESARVLSGLGGKVVERIYPGMGHTINEDEIREVRIALADVLQPAASGDLRAASR
jgi:phospholipase/carboxylesterase